MRLFRLVVHEATGFVNPLIDSFRKQDLINNKIIV